MLWTRAFLLGLLSWAIPFAVSLAAFPLKRVNAPLFEAVMTLVLVMTAGVLFGSYFRGRSVAAGEAVVVGALWPAVNLVFDYPMFAYAPMKMTAAKYYSEIGVDYLVFSAFALAASRLATKEAEA